MRWLYGMFGSIFFVALVGMALAGEEQTRILGYFLWLGVPFIWLVLGNSVRCPRCGKHIWDNGRGSSSRQDEGQAKGACPSRRSQPVTV